MDADDAVFDRKNPSQDSNRDLFDAQQQSVNIPAQLFAIGGEKVALAACKWFCHVIYCMASNVHVCQRACFACLPACVQECVCALQDDWRGLGHDGDTGALQHVQPSSRSFPFMVGG